jgi:hypothetical protein
MNNFVTIIKLNILQLSNVTKMDIFEYKYVTCYENGVTQYVDMMIMNRAYELNGHMALRKYHTPFFYFKFKKRFYFTII